MSGQGWEVVGKSNKKPSVPAKKLTKTEKKKFVENAPKIEDILPLDQIKTLYTTLDKENRKPQTAVAKENDVKKPKKKVQEKKKEPVKAVPKSLDSAAHMLDLKELASVMELNQARFPDSALWWLKALAEFLNVRLAHSGSAALPRPRDSFLTSLPVVVRDALQRAVEQAGRSAMQPFFEHALTAMANDMSKGNAAVAGYKILLQLVAMQAQGTLVVDQVKVTTLRNSYQNQQPIGLAILWALGQLGMKDLAVGLKVWQEFMLPMLEMRNYSTFVVSYLKEISSVNQPSKPPSAEQLVALLDSIYPLCLGLPANTRQDMYDAIAALTKRTLEFEPDRKLRLFFQPFLQRLNPTTPKPLTDVLLSSLVMCLKSDTQCYSIWRQAYDKNTVPSAILLEHLTDKHWTSVNMKLLQETLVTFQVTNAELLKGKQRGDAVKRCNAACEKIQEKMAVKKSFPWKLTSFMLVLAIAGLVAFDVKKSGCFKSSNTGVFLRDVGALRYGEIAWTGTKRYSSDGVNWARENVPVYYKEASDRARPYLQQAKDVAVVVGSHANQTFWNAYSYAQEKAPVVEAWINHYAPGLIGFVQKTSLNVWDLTKEYSFWAGQYLVKQSIVVGDWARTNIFVGNLSPEKLHQYSQEAINTTQVYAAWTYDWVIQKVHTLSRVQ